jgi:hypothetical protein
MMVSEQRSLLPPGLLDQFMRLTSSRRQAAVLWTEPPDDAAQQDEISSNEWGGCDDEVHCSITTH